MASWSEGCGKFPRPAVYSSVPLVVDWILQQFDGELQLEVSREQFEIQFSSTLFTPLPNFFFRKICLLRMESRSKVYL